MKERVSFVCHPLNSDCKICRKHSYCYTCGAGVKNQKYCGDCGSRLMWAALAFSKIIYAKYL